MMSEAERVRRILEEVRRGDEPESDAAVQFGGRTLVTVAVSGDEEEGAPLQNVFPEAVVNALSRSCRAESLAPDPPTSSGRLLTEGVPGRAPER